MWDDIKIGKGDHGNMSTKCPISDDLPFDISSNVRSYWLSDCFLGAGMVIMKDTPEGKKLTEMIKKKDIENIISFIDTLVVSKLSPAKIRQFIIECNQKFYDMGVESNQRAMRKVLGL